MIQPPLKAAVAVDALTAGVVVDTLTARVAVETLRAVGDSDIFRYDSLGGAVFVGVMGVDVTHLYERVEMVDENSNEMVDQDGNTMITWV